MLYIISYSWFITTVTNFFKIMNHLEVEVELNKGPKKFIIPPLIKISLLCDDTLKVSAI